MAGFISEHDIEQALLQRPRHLGGWPTLNCHTAQADDLNDGSGRADKREVILADRLRAAIQRLNPGLPPAAQEQALATLLQPRLAMSLVKVNREVDGLIRDGVAVAFEATQGPDAGKRTRLTVSAAPLRPTPWLSGALAPHLALRTGASPAARRDCASRSPRAEGCR